MLQYRRSHFGTTSKDCSMLKKLQERWGLKSGWQVVVVLLVFAATGTTVMLLKRPLVALFTENGEQPLAFTILYYIFILPVYYAILLVYAFLLGQFDFFWAFTLRTWNRIKGKKKNPDEQGS